MNHTIPVESLRAPRSAMARVSPVTRGKVLVVEDEKEQLDFLSSVIHEMGHRVDGCEHASEAIEKVRYASYDLVLTDHSLASGSTGTEVCARVRKLRPKLPVVILTGCGTLDTAVLALRAGATDFIRKPVEAAVLEKVIERAITLPHCEARSDVSEAPLAILGESPTIRHLREMIWKVAESSASVLITGKSGTGKELVARSVHAASDRAEGPFVGVNCAAIPPSMLESELFGHVRGAFTDAKVSRPGLLVQANHGTIFLDEIGDLATDLQAKLLRALQERKIRPVGGTAEVPFDARVISATNRDLEHEIACRHFREDLYYRLNVVQIRVPTLSERGGDVRVLATFFLNRALKEARLEDSVHFDEEAMGQLSNYDWPGNVRELQNCVERAVALRRTHVLTVEDLPERIRAFRQVAPADLVGLDRGERAGVKFPSMEEIERKYILQVVEAMGGNKRRAASILGLDRRTLYRKLALFEHQTAREGGR